MSLLELPASRFSPFAQVIETHALAQEVLNEIPVAAEKAVVVLEYPLLK